ncbi:(R)-mandelonitrile lyase [Sinorhizobium meliloti]|uniref:(R)-mandelonitrile lyase n=1 Tax=Rhizobium meliloti TaxID=382 RepID=UPI001F32F06A|nr:cupin domain-containing protein [Sinorhizobium meliloti]
MADHSRRNLLKAGAALAALPVAAGFAGSAVAQETAGASGANTQQIQITPNRSTPSVIGDPAQFSGHVVIDPLFPANEFTGATGGLVTFAPGARTAWHTHPAGQILMVTEGRGWIQEEGSEKREINPGDVIWIPVGVNHWHGATNTSGMAHTAISYMRDGSNVIWGELVTDEEFAN